MDLPVDHMQGDCPENGLNFLGMSAALSRDDLKCALCGEHIDRTQRFQLDRYDNVLCPHHEVGQCCICRRFIIGESVRLKGYGRACLHCSTPRTSAELSAAMKFVERFYLGRNIRIPAYEPVLVAAEEMSCRYGSRFNVLPLGVTDVKGNYRIELMSQQSPVSLVHTLAHEVLHVWMHDHGLRPPLTFAEGFCNLGAFLVTAQIDRNEALVKLFMQMENPDRAYGVAFRELKVVHDVYGWATVVSAIRKWHRSDAVGS